MRGFAIGLESRHRDVPALAEAVPGYAAYMAARKRSEELGTVNVMARGVSRCVFMAILFAYAP